MVIAGLVKLKLKSKDDRINIKVRSWWMQYYKFDVISY